LDGRFPKIGEAARLRSAIPLTDCRDSRDASAAPRVAPNLVGADRGFERATPSASRDRETPASSATTSLAC